MLTDYEKEQARLLRKVATAPVVRVVGVVDPSGAFGGKARYEKQWSLCINFPLWRAGDGNIQTKTLNLRRPIAESKVQKEMGRVKPLSVLAFDARVLDVPGQSQVFGRLVKMIGTDKKDAELNDRAIDLHKPCVIKDATFGKLKLDRRVDWFECKATWNKRRIALNVSAADPVEAAKLLKTAHALWKDQAKWTRRVNDFAVKELLSLKNETWLQDGEKTLSSAQFVKKMKLESITVGPGGSFDFWHDDGDLFWGHSIQVGGTLAKGPTRADIPG